MQCGKGCSVHLILPIVVNLTLRNVTTQCYEGGEIALWRERQEGGGGDDRESRAVDTYVAYNFYITRIAMTKYVATCTVHMCMHSPPSPQAPFASS